MRTYRKFSHLVGAGGAPTLDPTSSTSFHFHSIPWPAPQLLYQHDLNMISTSLPLCALYIFMTHSSPSVFVTVLVVIFSDGVYGRSSVVSPGHTYRRDIKTAILRRLFFRDYLDSVCQLACYSNFQKWNELARLNLDNQGRIS
ncbi:hypothetical protein CPB86DRAFT_802982 [Serendipita vermifera]|nr:hypothetical protein CPB86DRAFT_802982 [Serendipita vermifera]